MLGQPVRRILLGADDAGERGQVLYRPLLDARTGRGLKAKDEHESGHHGSFHAVAEAKVAPSAPYNKRQRWRSCASVHQRSEEVRGSWLPAFGAAAVLLAALSTPAAADTARSRDNDYPTATRADYVIGCMAANGNTREALLKCSCAIDTIAGLMPYPHYEEAETALSLQLGGGVGGRVGLFRDPPQIKAVIEELRRAQAEANLQCR
jgi:hypothetical protein